MLMRWFIIVTLFFPFCVAAQSTVHLLAPSRVVVGEPFQVQLLIDGNDEIKDLDQEVYHPCKQPAIKWRRLKFYVDVEIGRNLH